MNGIIIWGKEVKNGSAKPESLWCTDFTFEDIIDCIDDSYLGNLFWSFTGMNYSISCTTSENYDLQYEAVENLLALFIDESLETEDENRYARPGYLPAMKKYVSGDWTDICGSKEYCQSLIVNDRADYGEVEKHCEIFFSCIDAGQWEVYCKDQSVLIALGNKFSFTKLCLLKDKQF